MEIREAVEQVVEAIDKRPEKNILNIWEDLENGRKPKFCPLTIGRVSIEYERKGPEETAIREDTALKIAAIPEPLKLENPFTPALSLDPGEGTGFMANGFGVPICRGSYTGGVAKHLSPGEIENLEAPVPEEEPRFKKMKEMIDFYVDITPEDIKICTPDMQGPFNIAYSLLGSEIFFLMKDSPERVHRLMDIVTGYYINCHRWFKKNVPGKRWINFIGLTRKISECACNLISKDLYREFVAPYDRKLVDLWGGEVGIHPCSGAHVFEVTLETFHDEVRYTECGIIPSACAGYLTLEQAMGRVGRRDIILSVGEELVQGKEEETIKKHLDCFRKHRLLILAYSGMYYWTSKADAHIRDMHKRLDLYYYENL